MCICWLGWASTIQHMKWFQQSHAWSGMCICWLGCASTIQHMKWNVYLLTWLYVNNDKKLRQWFLRYTLARQSCCDFPLPWWSRKSLGSYLIYWSKTQKIYTDFLHFQIPVRIKREKEMQVRHTKTLAHTDTKHTHTHQTHTHTHTHMCMHVHTHTHTHLHRHACTVPLTLSALKNLSLLMNSPLCSSWNGSHRPAVLPAQCSKNRLAQPPLISTLYPLWKTNPLLCNNNNNGNL